MSTLDKRLDRLAEPEMPPVNPLALAAVECAEAHPDHARLLTAMAEANRTGRLPTDPLVLALVRVVGATIAADHAGLFQSDYGERLYQLTDMRWALALRLEAMNEATARQVAALEHCWWQTVAAFVAEHLPALQEHALDRYLREVEGWDPERVRAARARTQRPGAGGSDHDGD